jgi:hypothetical protein
MQQRESPGAEFIGEGVKAGKIAARSIETRNEPDLHGVSADAEDDWDAGGCSLSRESGK